MLHFIKIIISTLVVLFFSIELVGQSLPELVQQSYNTNLDLKILEKEYLAALEKAPQISQLPDPEVSVALFPFPIETRLGPQIFRVGATQMLPWKGKLNSQKELELAKAKALYERISARQLDLQFQIKQAWYQLYEIEQSQVIVRRNLNLLEALSKTALAKVESGKATGADVLRVQLKQEELQQELAILETAKAKPTTTINQLLNRSLNTPITIESKLDFAQIPYNLDTLIATIQANHPTIRMFTLQQEVAQKAMDLNRLDSKPDFGVGFDYIMTNKLENAVFENNGRDVIIPRVSVKIPLYKQKYAAKEREEQLKMEALEIKKENVVEQFRAIIDKANTDYEMARLKTDLYNRQIVLTQSAITILESEYSAKGDKFDELLQLEKALIDYDLKMLRAIVQSHQAKNQIERFTLFE
ncbi:MAG: TolC family protein [Bacteroidota bacterium]